MSQTNSGNAGGGKTPLVARIFPFVTWFRGYRAADLRADFVSVLTVALVLIPQSMAYAQLAGLPPYYGLYAAFLPPMVAALFGSSRQLATGPVAVVSLMTAAALEPLASAGSEAFVAYAVVMAMVVGLFQLGLGLLRLGVIVNFLSHPVVNGFTNAAALIIASSQLSKIFGVYVDKGEHHYETVIRVVVAAVHYTHLPTLGLAVLAFGIMAGLKRLAPRAPFVLVAVAVTATIAWATGFEHDVQRPMTSIKDKDLRGTITRFNEVIEELNRSGEQRAKTGKKLLAAEEKHGDGSRQALKLLHQKDLINLSMSRLKGAAHDLRVSLRNAYLHGVPTAGGLVFYADDKLPPGTKDDGRHWRIKVGNKRVSEDAVTITGGGSLVGVVPRGLPTLGLPQFDLSLLLQFLPVAMIISLLGFMEAISIAKAMAAKTGQRLDPNRELIGQGLANILGSFGQSYPVSGSFSRSAVNIGAGVVSGMSSVFTSLVVVVTLLLFTPLLYYIPQSVLAAVIMMAVIGLVNVRGFVHAYRAQRYDGIIAVITFVCTLGFAPHLDRGILVGVVLSLGHYLYRNSRPVLATLSLHPDYSYRDADRHNLRRCEHLAVVRFHGPLFFANASYLEDKINAQLEQHPDLRHILLAASGINEIDASGEEALSLLVDRVRNRGVEISFSGLNEQVRDLFARTHLLEKVGEDHIFPTTSQAVQTLHEGAHHKSKEQECPLREVCFVDGGQDRQDEKPHVLVVDDEPQYCEYLGKRLRRRGFEVTVCSDPTEALPTMERTYHELVLMDVRMPDLSGVDLLREMNQRWENLAVIMVTGHGTRDQAFDLGKMGAFDLLTKPVDIDHLVKVMDSALANARHRQKQAHGRETPDVRQRSGACQ